jgi:Zn-dependent protease
VALRFKLLGVPVAIGADFAFVMVVLAALWRTPEELPAWLVVVTGSVLLHELGHAILLEHYGFEPSVRLYSGGGLTLALTEERISPPRHILVAAAGPALGLAVGGLAGLAVLAAPGLARNDVVQDLLWVNLGWGLINLLPVPGADGGAIVSELTTMVLGRPADKLGQAAGVVVVGAVVVGLAVAGLHVWAFVVGFFAVFTAGLGLLSSHPGRPG